MPSRSGFGTYAAGVDALWMLRDMAGLILTADQAAGTSLPPKARLNIAILLMLMMIGALGVLLVITAIRWSLRRAVTSTSASRAKHQVPTSAWSMAGSRAKPIDPADDGSSPGGSDHGSGDSD